MRLAPVLVVIACVGVTVGAMAGCDRGGSIVRKDSPQVPQAAKPANGRPAFVGTWAATKTACGHAAWRMTADQLQSPGAVHCSVSSLTPTLAGYTINSACSSGGADTPGRIVATMNGGTPAQGMTLQGGPFAEPVALVRCSA